MVSLSLVSFPDRFQRGKMGKEGLKEKDPAPTLMLWINSKG